MLKIGLIGAESFHSRQFALFANGKEPDFEDICINAVYGETSATAHSLATEFNIPYIADTPLELLRHCDAVMITLRCGSKHMVNALPFLRAGVPTWVDKPLTCNINEAEEMIATAHNSNALLSGGSVCRYCNDIKNIIHSHIEYCKKTKFYGANINFPSQLNSPYDGIYFYASHVAEFLPMIFGYGLKSIKADVTAGELIGIFKYDSYAISVNFTLAHKNYATLFYENTTEAFIIDPLSGYAPALRAFADEIIGLRAPKTPMELLAPVKILNALDNAAKTGIEQFLSLYSNLTYDSLF